MATVINLENDLNIMKRLFKPALLVIKNKKLLVVREGGSDFWLTPGGAPENKENNEQCLRREIMEELGVEIDRKTLRYFGEFEDLAALESNTLVHISAYLGDVIGEVKPSMEIEELAWVGENTTLLLSAIIKNKILPKLVEKGLVR